MTFLPPLRAPGTVVLALPCADTFSFAVIKLVRDSCTRELFSGGGVGVGDPSHIHLLSKQESWRVSVCVCVCVCVCVSN